MATNKATRRRDHPDTLHFLARVLVGVREADETRRIGGLFYEELLQRVKDALQTGHTLLWRPSDTAGGRQP